MGTEAGCPICADADGRPNVGLPWASIYDLYSRMYGDDVARHVRRTGRLRMLRCPTCDLIFSVEPVEGSPDYYRALSESDRLGFSYYPHHRPAYTVAARLARPGSRVLDVGCGAGNFAAAVATSDYTGLEFNDTGVRLATDRGLAVHKESIAEHIKRAGAIYDLVCAFEVLEHVADPLNFLKDCARALRSNGRLFISVPSADSFYPFVLNELLNLPPHHLTRWSDKAISNLERFVPIKLVSLTSPSISASGHARLYLQHLAENASLAQSGLNYHASICIEPEFDQIRAAAIETATALQKGIKYDHQLPRGVTVCAEFSLVE